MMKLSLDDPLFALLRAIAVPLPSLQADRTSFGAP